MPALNKILNDIGKDATFDGIKNNLSKQLKESVEKATKEIDLSKVGKATGGNSNSKAYTETIAALKEQMRLVTQIETINRQRLSAGPEEARYLSEAVSHYQSLLTAARERASQNRANVTDQQELLNIEKQEELLVAKISAEVGKNERAQRRVTDAIKEQSLGAKMLQAIQASIVSSLTQMAVQMTVGAVKNFWHDAWTYATQYYDKLNEIRVVTGQTAQQSEQVGQKLRTLAQEMSVSSSEMAEGAITFYRQGLGDDEVNERLIATTEYAKTAGISFEQSANMITASVNTIAEDARGVEMTAQRVADVFLYLGDNAATSGEEIGTAMSRSAALADAAGVSFEMLGAYIATVSERTRQDAGTIGTALNAIMSRLTSVKQKGFNEEDETKVNDVAKALNSINVQLTDGEGQWRRIEDIFADVGAKWDELDDKTRNYLATTLAGTRQQNVFRTLMADLSKVDEGTSRAMELYTGALNSAGTAAQKYATYQESVTAAHDKMIASLEKLYSLFDANIMKNLYNVGGGLAEGLYGLLGGSSEQTQGYSGVISILTDQAASLEQLIQRYSELAQARANTFEGSSEQIRLDKEMSDLIDQISGKYPQLGKALEGVKTDFSNAGQAIDIMNGYLRDQMNLIDTYTGTELTKKLQEDIKAYAEGLRDVAVNQSAQDFYNALSPFMFAGMSSDDAQEFGDAVSDIIVVLQQYHTALNNLEENPDSSNFM